MKESDRVDKMVRQATQADYRRERATTLFGVFGVARADLPKMLIPMIIAGVGSYYATKYDVAKNSEDIEDNDKDDLQTRLDLQALTARVASAETRLLSLEWRQDQIEALQAIGKTLLEIRDGLVDGLVEQGRKKRR